MSRFVVQLHDATTLHFDLRLEVGGTLRSWAVPKGPSLDPRVRRLAVRVDDHSLEAGDFEGVHQAPTRGSGAVIVWDVGTAEIVRNEPDHVSFVLDGRKRSGRFALTRTDHGWILVKGRDAHAPRAPTLSPSAPKASAPAARGRSCKTNTRRTPSAAREHSMSPSVTRLSSNTD